MDLIFIFRQRVGTLENKSSICTHCLHISESFTVFAHLIHGRLKQPVYQARYSLLVHIRKYDTLSKLYDQFYTAKTKEPNH